MESSTSLFNMLWQYVANYPADPLFFVLMGMLLYFLFAAISFAGTAKTHIDGGSKVVNGSLVKLDGHDIVNQFRNKAATRNLLTAILLLSGSLFMPTSFSVWIRLAVIGGMVVVAILLAVITKGNYRWDYHHNLQSAQNQQLQNEHQQTRSKQEAAKAIKWLENHFDNQKEFYTALRLYGEQQFILDLNQTINTPKYGVRHLEPFVPTLKRLLRRHKEKVNIICTQAFPQDPTVFSRAQVNMNLEAQKQCDNLLEEMLNDNDASLAARNILAIRDIVQSNLK